MKTLKIISTLLLLTMVSVSCKKEEPLGNVDNIPGLGGDTWVPGPIDTWLLDSLTTPYNIAVKYKWDQGELNQFFNKILVPPKEEKVVPLMSSIKKAWADVYIQEAGLPFFKKISPKYFYLVGSPIYVNGAIIVGTAEGGRKVVLSNVNDFRTKGMPGYTLNDTANVKEVFETIDHEFAHILDQNVKFPVDFSRSSASSYTSDWLNVTPFEAMSEGFISQYAISGAIDDWAETVAILLVRGQDWFDQYVNGINYTGTTPNGTTAAQARARLISKEAEVIKYFKDAWNIDFQQLQARSRTAINSLLF